MSKEAMMTELSDGGFIADDETSETPRCPFMFNFSIANPPEAIQLNRWRTGHYEGQIEFMLNDTGDKNDEYRDSVEVEVHVGPINPGYDSVRLALFGPKIGDILNGTSPAYVDAFCAEFDLNPHRSRLAIVEELLKKNMTHDVTEWVFSQLMAALPSTSLKSMFESD